MEPTRVASSQGTQPAHAARTKSSSHPATAEAGDPAAGGGFLALLAALGDAAQDWVGIGLAGAHTLGADGFSGATSTAVDASAVAAWQGLLGKVPGDGMTPLVAGKDAGSTLSTAQGVGGASSAICGGEWTPFGRPQGLVAETAMLDSAADLKDGQPSSALSVAGRAFSRVQSGAALRPGVLGGGDASSGPGTLGELKPQPSGHPSASTALSQVVSERAALASSTGAQTPERSGGPSSAAASIDGTTPLTDGMLAAAASVRAPEFSAGGRSSGESSGPSGSWAEGASPSSPV